eukprot:TRINITY_DN16150_c0_g1_i1.p1 TRINITY_DN16150_c0_g1~~TRINITY_DN16150_c0_g1_i1.p1  ORF type:complete len:467 (+),score=101.25 TRINITY_DN16150_c0_g1_i1:44-1444(+)
MQGNNPVDDTATETSIVSPTVSQMSSTTPRLSEELIPGCETPTSRKNTPPRVYRWKQIDPGEGPATRGRHTVGIDTKRGNLIMFGGQNYDMRRKYNDVARFDLSAERWIDTGYSDEQLSPCARSSHASVTTEDALYIFGGATGKSFVASPGCCRDASTWRYDFQTSEWSKLEAAGIDEVSSRYGHTTVLAPDNKVYLFGGMTDAGCDWNTFKIDLVEQVVEKLECLFVGSDGDVCGPNPDKTPPHEWIAREEESPVRTAKQVRDCVRGFGHTAIYNPNTDSMYVLGGTIDGRHYHSTFLRLDIKTRRWMLEESKNKPPEGRYVHCAAFDESRNAMYIFGGYCGSYRSDVHEYDFATKQWTEIKPHPAFQEGPCLRSGACSVVWKDHLYIFGGCDDQRYYNDVWKLRLWNDTFSLKEALVEWVAWEQHSGGLTFDEESLPRGLSEELEKKKADYKLLTRSNNSDARM